jgi:PAS domain S-box-containing protein
MRRMQEALRRREETLEVALEAASLGTWDHDLTSGALHWDARAKSLFGLPPDVAVTADTWARVIHPDDLAALEASRERALHQRAPFSAEYRVSWPDGSLHSIAMIGRATFDPASDRPLRMAGIMLDTTERKRQEERLQEAVRLEAIGRLAGGIAHDLNNMLAAILGFSEFLAQGMPPGDARRHDVDQITQAASRSAALTRQLLAFARRELIQPHRLDVNAVVTRIEPMLHALLGESVELVLALAPEPVVIYADAAQVEQSLTNLVLNARDAMPQGGRVTIETGVVALGPGAPGPWPELEKPGSGRYVMLAVKDTGHGMDPVTLQRIWEPFFTTKPAGRGTGLGLSAVYGAVRQCGGFVWAESEPGRGTVVSLYWPELAGAPEPAPEAGPPNAERGSESVLVVEDEPLVRRLVVRGLETLGYHCAEAVNAADAMDLVERGAVHPDLVITDVVLPEQSGRTLGERLAALQPGLPVLFISGYASEDMIRRGLLEPGRPFLQKPFTPAELAREVRMVLDSAAERRRAGAPGM